MFYFVCFLLGLFLSGFSLLGGMGHFGGHVHLPHAAHPVPMPHGAAHPAHGAGAGQAGQNTPTVPWWNTFSMMVFLCWFGAAGYLLTRYGSFVAGVVLILALLCGLAGGAIVFFFLAKVLLPHEHELTADETDVVGAVGRISAAIRAGGIGEMVYEQLGARRAVPARAEDGEAVGKDEEVFAVRYEKGIAYVRRWEDEEMGVQGTRD
jgi:hypothetical protein